MKYTVKQYGRGVELSEANSSILIYRIPYQDLLNGIDSVFRFRNKFIVLFCLVKTMQVKM